MSHVLFLVSSARELTFADGSTQVTGYFADEALTAFDRLTEAGVDIVIATVDGRPPLADPYGLEPCFHYSDEAKDFLASVTRTFARDAEDIRLTLHHLTELGLASARRVFLALRERGLDDAAARDLINRAARIAWCTDRSFPDVLVEDGLAGPLSRGDIDRAVAGLDADSTAGSARVAARLAELPGFQRPANLAELTDTRIAEFDAVFVPGGHGPMVDLADNPDVGRVLRILHGKNAPIASLSHGPAFLLSAPANSEGQWLFDGYRLTSFTDEEESQTPQGKAGPQWWLETALKGAGAVFDEAPTAWTSHVVVDRNLITAQNPNSAVAAAEALLTALAVGTTPMGAAR